MKIMNVVGARPNFMKIAPLCRTLAKAKEQGIETLLVHTGQHYDDNMSKIFFKELGMPEPDVNLGAGSGSHAEQTAKIMLEFEKLCLKEKPDLIIVVGDVNSTLACSIVAAKLLIPVAHVEAGLRSFDRTMPEEINRIVTDALSSYLFTTCADAEKNLKKEGVSAEKIFFAGNVMIDTLYHCLPQAERTEIRTKLNIGQGPYIFVTLHRPSNVDDDKLFGRILNSFVELSKKAKIIFPVHPRTRKSLSKMDIYNAIKNDRNLQLIDPIGYLDCLALMKGAALVITDSGGIQEETTVLEIPCITLRKNTERPITITEGTNILVGENIDLLIKESEKILSGHKKKGRIPKFWDGHAAERIVKVLLKKIK